MKRTILTGLGCFVIFSALVLAALADSGAGSAKAGAAAGSAPAKDILMTIPGGKGTQGPVTLSHSKHAALECRACHHKLAEDPKNLKCSGCHSDLTAKTGKTSFYAAFHDMKSANSCVGCHKAGKKGPTVCNKCHAAKK